jgi:hypothetical protein
LIPGENLVWSDWRSVDWAIRLEHRLADANCLSFLANDLPLLMEDKASDVLSSEREASTFWTSDGLVESTLQKPVDW